MGSLSCLASTEESVTASMLFFSRSSSWHWHFDKLLMAFKSRTQHSFPFFLLYSPNHAWRGSNHNCLLEGHTQIEGSRFKQWRTGRRKGWNVVGLPLPLCWIMSEVCCVLEEGGSWIGFLCWTLSYLECKDFKESRWPVACRRVRLQAYFRRHLSTVAVQQWHTGQEEMLMLF